jgi:hypothetical protein
VNPATDDRIRWLYDMVRALQDVNKCYYSIELDRALDRLCWIASLKPETKARVTGPEDLSLQAKAGE